jgi:hypothetical protein
MIDKMGYEVWLFFIPLLLNAPNLDCIVVFLHNLITYINNQLTTYVSNAGQSRESY